MAGTRPIRRKEWLFDDEIYQHGPFVTIYCHLRRYLVGAHSVRPGSAKSYGSWANNVRPYGSAGADEFTNGVPRSYPKAPSLVAFTAAKRIHHRTGRHACSSAVMGLHQPITAGTRPIRRKERSFNDEIYLHGPFVTIYCHLRRYLVGAHTPTAVGVQRATAVGGS